MTPMCGRSTRHGLRYTGVIKLRNMDPVKIPPDVISQRLERSEISRRHECYSGSHGTGDDDNAPEQMSLEEVTEAKDEDDEIDEDEDDDEDELVEEASQTS